MNNRADNHQANNWEADNWWADNWVDKENDVNEKKLHLFKRKKRGKQQKVASFFKKRALTVNPFFSHKSQKSKDVGS